MRREHLELRARLERYSPDDPAAALTFTQRLARENRWPFEYAQRVVGEYKRFAFLAIAAGHPVTPSDQVDQAWHLHLTYTRSYWEEFCQKVLRQSLHHQPTKGGAGEENKFHDWYQRTLESYERNFGETPPQDIWPEAAHRFGEDIHFTRVNTSRHWIIPKPRWRAATLVATSLLALAIGAVGCRSAFSANTSPPDAQNAAFLTFYLLATPAAVFAAAVLRRRLRSPHRRPGPDELPGDPYVIAVLSGDSDRVADTAIVSLVQQGAAVVGSGAEASVQPAGPIAPGAHPVERQLRETIERGLRQPPDLRATLGKAAGQIADALTHQRWLLGNGDAANAVLLPLAVALVMPITGLASILIRVAQNKPVGFLALLVTVTTIIAFVGFGRRPRRTVLGDRILEILRTRHRRSRPAGTETSQAGGVSHLVMGVALHGLNGLTSPAHRRLKRQLTPRTNSSGGCSSGCGFTAESASGCGGGGCGGCGGGGD